MVERSGPALPEIGFDSIGDLVAARAGVDPGRAAVRFRAAGGKWTELSWGELDERRRVVAAGLSQLGVGRGDTVAVVAHNSPEMLIAELAVISLGAASAALFPDGPAEVLSQCLTDSGAKVVLAGSAAQQHRLRGFEKVVVLDDQPLAGGIPLKSLSGSIELPRVSADEVAFVLYTGGTTGRQKGVELTHRNALAQQAAMSVTWEISEKDVFLSYLPWHHSFGSLFERLMALWHRATLVLDDSRGKDLDKLLGNLAEVKPTVYFGVPRVYHALAARTRRDPKAHGAVFKGSLRFVFSAAAPVSEEVFDWFEKNGVPVLEGWGLTEASPCVTVTRPGTPRAPGIDGWPLPGTTVRLEKGDHPRFGEAVVRGPQVMKGYRNLPAETARVLRNGELWTGDLAEWTPTGLRLHGRADGVFKLENGEKVSSGEVELRILAATPLVEQCVVLGHGQVFVTALCWVAPGPARRFVEQRGLDLPKTYAELSRVPELRRALAEALQAANLLTNLPSERIRRVGLVPDPPSLEKGEITDTLRMVRIVAGELHEDLAAAMRHEVPHPQVIDLIRRGDAFGHS